MNIILFDQKQTWHSLLPITFIRPISEIRIGILKIKEKWELISKTDSSYLTMNYLSSKFKCKYTTINYYVNSSIIPSAHLFEEIKQLSFNQKLVSKDKKILIAFASMERLTFDEISNENLNYQELIYHADLIKLNSLPDILKRNGTEIENDFTNLTPSKKVIIKLNEYVTTNEYFINKNFKSYNNVFFRTSHGSIFIGKNVTIKENVVIEGPVAICDNSIVETNSVIKRGTTIGPLSKVGGVIENTIILGNSNKAHSEYIGNSIIGEWCNIGAGTNSSNVKNDYTNVKLYNYATDQLEDTGTQFCGLFMGDYTKAGISTMFNTGTVVGVNVNVFGAGFQDKHIPSFTWGGASEGYSEYRFDKAIQVINETMKRRNMSLSEEDLKILAAIETGINV